MNQQPVWYRSGSPFDATPSLVGAGGVLVNALEIMDTHRPLRQDRALAQAYIRTVRCRESLIWSDSCTQDT